jgi:hypothetical protein
VLLILVATLRPVVRVVLVTKDWLLGVVLRVGIAEYNAHMYSRLTVEEVRLDRLTPRRRRLGSASRQRARSQSLGDIDQRLKSGQALVWVML